MEIQAVEREENNVLEAECSKVPSFHEPTQQVVHNPVPILSRELFLEAQKAKQMQPKVFSYLLELFSVRFVDFEPTKFSDMYGCILIRTLPTYVVMSRKLGEPLNINSKGFIKLKDPEKVIQPLDPISIYPFLYRYEARTDQLEYNDCRVMWQDQFHHDIFMRMRVESLFGEIEVNYAVYRYGVFAHVNVTLTGSQFSSATTVHGLITAHNSKIGNKGKSILFRIDDGEDISVDVSPCHNMVVQLPLARCKTAVPFGSSLIIGVRNFGTPGQTIAKNEKIVFDARLNGQEVKTFRGAACQINVAVTWSHYLT